MIVLAIIGCFQELHIPPVIALAQTAKAMIAGVFGSGTVPWRDSCDIGGRIYISRVRVAWQWRGGVWQDACLSAAVL